jgi:hypothetical protein
MNSRAIKSLVICAIGAAVIAGCASSPSSPAVAFTQGNVQSGKVVAVETTAVVNQTAMDSSSGSSGVATTASGGPPIVTVLFNDGTQGRYIIERPAAAHTVGEPVYVITDRDRTTMMSRR